MLRLPTRPLPLLALAAALTGCAGLPAPGGAEPAVQQLVAEDEQVRIAELRVRGQTQRLTVQPKHGAPGYEVLPAPGGQDPSGRRDTAGSAGQRVWVWAF